MLKLIKTHNEIVKGIEDLIERGVIDCDDADELNIIYTPITNNAETLCLIANTLDEETTWCITTTGYIMTVEDADKEGIEYYIYE